MRFSPRVAAIVPLVFAALTVTSSARPHPTPSPSPPPVADPAITKLARQQFVDWQAGIVNQHLYAPQVTEKLTDEKVTDTSRALGQLGALTDAVFIGPWADPSFPPGARGYIYQMLCQSGKIYLWLALDSQGKIATIFFKNRLDTETITPAPSPS
ncbi:MAG: hypothetical protein ABSD52_13935 [Candidatus Cybelea sp.]|jgi:hypothetical protein